MSILQTKEENLLTNMVVIDFPEANQQTQRRVKHSRNHNDQRQQLKNSLTEDRHTRSSKEVLSGILRKENTLEKKVSELESIREDSSYSRQRTNNIRIIDTHDVEP